MEKEKLNHGEKRSREGGIGERKNGIGERKSGIGESKSMNQKMYLHEEQILDLKT